MAGLLTAVCCGGPSSVSPTGPAVIFLNEPTGPITPTTPADSPRGNWAGSIRDPISGEGTIRLSLVGVSEVLPLVGEWSATFPTGEFLAGRALAGTDGGKYETLLFADPAPRCDAGTATSALVSYTLTEMAINSGQMTGVLRRLNCSGVVSGTLNLSKQ